MIYYFAEVQNPNSFREAEKLTAKNLTAAKQMASKRQAFQNTELVIGTKVNSDGFILPDDILSVKRDGRWIDSNDEDED